MNPNIPNIQPFEGLVAGIGKKQFGPNLLGFFSSYIDFDELTVYFFPQNEKPRCVLVEAHGDRNAIAKSAAEQYVTDGYLDDVERIDLQIKLHGRSNIVSSVHRDEVINDDFRDWFDSTAIEDKVLWVARFGGGFLNTNLYRTSGKPHFNEAEIDAFLKLSRFAYSCLKVHLASIEPLDNSERRDIRLRTIEQLLSTNRSSALSARESEVCARIVMGYSTTAIALGLNIAENTVKTVRKHAYAKLEISSQNELFALVLESVLSA